MTDSAGPTPPRPTARPSNPFGPIVFVGLVILGIGAVIAISKWRAPPELVPWQDNLPKAQAAARATNKPILLYFTAEWCGPCQEMRRRVWTDSDVAAAAARFIPVRIDVDRQPDLAKQFNIEAMPTFYQLTPDGHRARSYEGAMEAAQMITWLTPHS